MNTFAVLLIPYSELCELGTAVFWCRALWTFT